MGGEGGCVRGTPSQPSVMDGCWGERVDVWEVEDELLYGRMWGGEDGCVGGGG